MINEVSVHRTCSLFDLLRQNYVVVTNKLKSCLLSYSKYILDYYEDSDFLPTSLNPINAIFRCFIFGILYLFFSTMFEIIIFLLSSETNFYVVYTVFSFDVTILHSFPAYKFTKYLPLDSAVFHYWIAKLALRFRNKIWKKFVYFTPSETKKGF